MERTETPSKAKGKEEQAVQFTKRSGKGLQEGRISELTTIFDVKPGHEQELRAALKRFVDFLRASPVEETMKTGLRSSRHVIIDGGKRVMWLTTFEQDWDPYIEDAFIVVGIDKFVDWLQHTEAKDAVEGWLKQAGGIEKIRAARGSYKGDPAQEKAARASSAGLKEIINNAQFQAAQYFDPLSDLTHPEVRKAQKVYQAFQKVLDNPKAGELLKDPAFKPLLELASE